MQRLLVLIFAALAAAQSPAPSPHEWGAPPVNASHGAGRWTIAGTKQTVSLDERDLSLTIQAGPATWKTAPSSVTDLVVHTVGDEFNLRIADAGELRIEPWRTGYMTGVKVTADGFRNRGQNAPGGPVGLRLVLTIAMEGGDEDVVFQAMALEQGASVRELNWPPAIDGRTVDTTVLSNDDGMLVPRNWPKPYHPIRRATNDTSVIQSNLIESWSMSWWGFEQGASSMMVIVETPDDAAYTFSHPAGGPTSIGPAWRPQLGRFGYPRSLRMAFLSKGNYVALCKRYRRFVIDSGLFVSLQDKIARNPLVKNLVGNPFASARVLRNLNPKGPRYDPKNPENNYRLTTYAENVQRLKKWKAEGWTSVNVTLSGWPRLGYDREHPDALPPNKDAGGWEGMKSFFDACRELGFTCWLHDQYRDYYLDAPSFDREFALREEDSVRPPTHFPGTRFHPNDWKEGYIPMMNYWDGGPMAYMNNRLMLGHFIKNYRLMFEHGIRPQGSYNDVFGYIPPDEDFHPEHPNTRTESMNFRASVFNWTRAQLGIVGTEDAADWTIPFVDYATSRFNRNPGSGNDESSEGAIPVPLYELVYHDAIITTGNYDPRSWLHGNAASLTGDAVQVRRRLALHRRVGLLQMMNHEFLDKERRKERTTFADGTTVTVDWDTRSVAIKPDL